MSDGIYITDDPDDITGCLEDALHKVIKAEPIERRLRHDQVFQHGLQTYPQWIDDLESTGQVTADEADILLQARLATMKVVRVDEFEPGQLQAGIAAHEDSPSADDLPANKAIPRKAVPKKAVRKKAVRKKAVRKKAVRKRADDNN